MYRKVGLHVENLLKYPQGIYHVFVTVLSVWTRRTPQDASSLLGVIECWEPGDDKPHACLGCMDKDNAVEVKCPRSLKSKQESAWSKGDWESQPAKMQPAKEHSLETAATNGLEWLERRFWGWERTRRAERSWVAEAARPVAGVSPQHSSGVRAGSCWAGQVTLHLVYIVGRLFWDE